MTRIKKPKLRSKSFKRSSFSLSPTVPEAAKARSRREYRKSRGKDFELTGSVVLRALEFLDLEVKHLPVVNQLTADTQTMPIFRLTHVAKLLNVSYQTLWRWTTETQQLPMPVLVDQTQGREYPVYHMEEVRVMVQVIGDHLTRFKYYRKDHLNTREKLFTEIEALRAINFGNHGETTHAHHEKRPRPRRKGKGRARKA